MIRLLLILISAVALSSCASTETKNRLGAAAASCITSAAKTIDDGISPASTVAYGIMSRCQRQIDAYDAVRLPAGVGFNVYATAAWNNRGAGWMQQITVIVLEQRARNKK